MNKIINISIIIIASLLAFSCIKEEGGDDRNSRQASLVAGVASKTVLEGNAVKWKDGDKISLVFTHPQKGNHVAEFSTEIAGGGTASVARFLGSLPLDLSAEGGYESEGYGVHPSTGVDQNGLPDYTLPVEQTAQSDGAFTPGINLSSAVVRLSDIDAGEESGVSFLNALSIIRFKLSSDVASVTFEGTVPFAGNVPLVFNTDGRLVIDGDSLEGQGSRSVTLLPPAGASEFSDGVVYNLLVWPGTHSSLTISLDFKSVGEYQKVAVNNFVFAPAKYYTLGFKAEGELVLNELEGKIDDLVGNLADIEGRTDDAEGSVAGLLKQIQSVALMTDNTANQVGAPYSVFSGTKQKDYIEVDYLIRPASVAQEIIDGHLDAMSAQVCYRNASGELSFATLPVTSAVLDGDIMTAQVDAASLSDEFYNGNISAELALQLSAGETHIMSDFAILSPKLGAGFDIRRTENIPVLKGATVSIPHKFATTTNTYTLSVTAEGGGISQSDVRITDNGYKGGYISVYVAESYNIADIRVKATLVSGDDVVEQTLTFVDGGTFDVSVSNVVDYIGGEVTVSVDNNSFGSYTMQLAAGGWIYETNTGVQGRYTVDDNNSDAERSAGLNFSIQTNDVASNGSISYSMSVAIVQKAYGTALTGNYFSEGEKLVLQSATAAGITKSLNVVILGDGYKKKDLLKGGKFERSANSAMDNFFGVAPFKDFRNRFNVYMAAYESADEGPRLSSVSEDQHSTYFKTYYHGSGNTFVAQTDEGKTAVNDVVSNNLGITGNDYYRTIVILLVNTSESIGSTDYPSMTTISTSEVGDGYASFAVATLAANSTGTGGLVRHEAGGHAFGRLGDEYDVSWYTPALVNERHSYGFYRNVAADTQYWNAFKQADYTDSEVMYDPYNEGVLYRSTYQSGIMWNNSGYYNAVSRWAIYDRIRQQTEGHGDYWSAFLSWDQNNR